MSRGRIRRGLSDEEKRLWAAVQQTAEPLRPETVPAPPPTPAPSKEPAPKPAKRPPAKPAAPTVPPYQAPAVQVPPSAVIDRRTLSRLSRGIIPVDARVDLHGLTQHHAHRRLLHFLAEAQAHGAKVVLVITGKGGPGEPSGHGSYERGVLRRAVPDWLRSPSFQPIVTGFSEAGRRHGGTGAIYVRIRRLRD